MMLTRGRNTLHMGPHSHQHQYAKLSTPPISPKRELFTSTKFAKRRATLTSRPPLQCHVKGGGRWGGKWQCLLPDANKGEEFGRYKLRGGYSGRGCRRPITVRLHPDQSQYCVVIGSP
ncbi:hypothetical protein E2C01_028702 [Portunus trituberculatus]|uniref:Uncharacterized protein n=1 Tax=Portunus trituberculatus TaxID=210409 RepID=A0A5B7ELC7_PORTR|nr:hypothetical protein [Portunus trituberculatus]